MTSGSPNCRFGEDTPQDINVAAPVLGAAAQWNFKHLLAALLAGFVFQSLLLPCLCDIGTAKTAFAYAFDVLVLIRIAAARACHETGKGWLFYGVLCYTSPAWIEGVAYLVIGGH
jgi:hypothetical protein